MPMKKNKFDWINGFMILI